MTGAVTASHGAIQQMASIPAGDVSDRMGTTDEPSRDGDALAGTQGDLCEYELLRKQNILSAPSHAPRCV